MTLRLHDSHIKSLLHFNFPHFAESGDGLADEVAYFSWTRSGNAKLAGSQSPADIIITGTPRFGYRCLHTESNSDYITGTASSAISIPQIEATMWVRPTASGTGNIISIKNSGTTIFTLSLNAENKLTLASSLLGLNLTSSETLSLNLWTYVRVQVSSSRANISVNNSAGISGTVASSTSGGTSISIPTQIPAVSSISLGGFHGQIDEFILRDEFTSTLPAEPVKASININDIGGFGTGALGNVTLNASCIMNTTGYFTFEQKNGMFRVNDISEGKFGRFKIGDEVMIKNWNNGRFIFRKITAISDYYEDSSSHLTVYVKLDSSPQDSEGYTFGSEDVIVNVPHFNTLTVNSGVTVTAHGYGTSGASVGYYSGLLAFRVKNDCTINGSIITSGKGRPRRERSYEANDKTSTRTAKIAMHSVLPDRFFSGVGGAIFIACGGTLTAPSSARIGAPWSGALNGGALNGGLNSGGGAGYGGGSSSGSTGEAGKIGWGGYLGNASKLGGSPGHNNLIPVDEINTDSSAENFAHPYSGSSVIIITKKLRVDEAAISTGGENAPVNSSPEVQGAGSGYCYIACKEML